MLELPNSRSRGQHKLPTTLSALLCVVTLAILVACGRQQPAEIKSVDELYPPQDILETLETSDDVKQFIRNWARTHEDSLEAFEEYVGLVRGSEEVTPDLFRRGRIIRLSLEEDFARALDEFLDSSSFDDRDRISIRSLLQEQEKRLLAIMNESNRRLEALRWPTSGGIPLQGLREIFLYGPEVRAFLSGISDQEAERFMRTLEVELKASGYGSVWDALITLDSEESQSVLQSQRGARAMLTGVRRSLGKEFPKVFDEEYAPARGITALAIVQVLHPLPGGEPVSLLEETGFNSLFDAEEQYELWRRLYGRTIEKPAPVLVLPTRPQVAQDDLTPRQMEIIQTVLSVEGFITEELHEEFWSSVPSAIRTDAATRADFILFIDGAIAAGVRFQRESWASMKLSLDAARVVKSPGYEIAKKSALNSSSLHQYKQQAQQAVANAEAMIKAAAEGEPFQTSRGPMYITPELVTQVLAGLDGSVARFRRLANPDWKESVTEHRYPEAHVAILSQVPFSLERQEVAVENGKTVKIVTLTNRLNETDFVGVTFNAYGDAWADPKEAAVRTVKAALKGIGATPSIVSSSMWRNRLSASGNGAAQTSEGSVYVSARVVEMREHGGALVFIAVTETSKLDADALREGLEHSTQVMR